jgi:hypothetical protein
MTHWCVTSNLISMSLPEPYDIAVGPDGSITVPADQVARMGLHPGEHLRVVRDNTEPQRPRRSVRGVGVGQVAAEDVLTWEDFEEAHEANVQAAEIRYGS